MSYDGRSDQSSSSHNQRPQEPSNGQQFPTAELTGGTPEHIYYRRYEDSETSDLSSNYGTPNPAANEYQWNSYRTHETPQDTRMHTPYESEAVEGDGTNGTRRGRPMVHQGDTSRERNNQAKKASLRKSAEQDLKMLKEFRLVISNYNTFMEGNLLSGWAKEQLEKIFSPLSDVSRAHLKTKIGKLHKSLGFSDDFVDPDQPRPSQ